MSARSAIVGPGLPVLSSATTPVLAMPVSTSRPSLLQVFGDDLRGAHFAVGKFRVLVKIAPPRDDLRVNRLDRGFEILGVAPVKPRTQSVLPTVAVL